MAASEKATKKATKKLKRKLVKDLPTFGSAAVVRRTVSEEEGARLQHEFGWRLTSRNADGTVTMSATSKAYKAELASR